MQETRVSSLVGKIPWRMATHPVFLSDEFHGQVSLAGYSQQGHKELEMTEQLTLSGTVDTNASSPQAMLQNKRKSPLRLQKKKKLNEPPLGEKLTSRL